MREAYKHTCIVLQYKLHERLRGSRTCPRCRRAGARATRDGASLRALDSGRTEAYNILLYDTSQVDVAPPHCAAVACPPRAAGPTAARCPDDPLWRAATSDAEVRAARVWLCDRNTPWPLYLFFGAGRPAATSVVRPSGGGGDGDAPCRADPSARDHLGRHFRDQFRVARARRPRLTHARSHPRPHRAGGQHADGRPGGRRRAR